MRKIAIAVVLAAGAAWAAPVPDFATRVQPALVKTGCFAGACHGAGAGQKGFKLSLLGYDPEADYQAIVYQYRGRRINMVKPENSLLVKKATMKLAHRGGLRFKEGSETYNLVLEWLKGGVPFDAPQPRRIASLTIEPPATLLNAAGGKVQLKVTATFTDGSRDDVTQNALYATGDDALASVADSGEATPLCAGETGITARYMGQFATARVGVRFAGEPTAIAKVTGKPRSFVDQLVNANLQRLRLLPSPRATDDEFLRRVYLDITGTLPTIGDVKAFLADTKADKRQRIVDQLLSSKEYTQFWSMWLLDLFRLSSTNAGDKNLPAFRAWLIDDLSKDTSFAEITRAMITSKGDGSKVPPVNYLRSAGDPKTLAEFTTEALMGSRSRCAQCHDHPFDSWTQVQYNQFTSFFVRVLKTDKGITLSDHGEIDHPKTGRPITPGFPDGKQAQISGDDRRTALAEWLTSPDNRYFAKSLVNRVWARLMGRGIIEPVDNLSASNAPSNPELMDGLSEYFKGRLAGNQSRPYSLKSLIRAITASDAYQRSAESNTINKADNRYYSHAIPKPLNAYMYSDAIAQVTGVPEPFGALPLGTRAIEVTDSHVESYFLDVCGRCLRAGTCDGPNNGAGGVPLALDLMNGPAINAKIAADGGRLSKLRSEGATPQEIVSQFYLAALSRPPSGVEKDYWLSTIQQSKNGQMATEDLIWALLSSRSFVFNR